MRWLHALTTATTHLGQSLPPYYCDFGSSTTRVIAGSRLVYNEPTCMAVHRQTGAVAALGTKAFALLGKTGPSLEIVFPIQNGSWVSVEAGELYLAALLTALKVPVTVRRYLVGIEGRAAIPPTLSSVNRQVFQRVLSRANLGRSTLTSRPVAIYRYQRPTKSDLQVMGIIDVGGQLTELSVVAGGELVQSTLIHWGGVQLTEAVQHLVLREHACSLGWHAAEEVKRSLLRVYAGVSKSQAEQWRKTKLAIRGKDVVTQTAKTVVLSAGLLEEISEQAFGELTEAVRDFLSDIPAELGASLLDQGLFLSGGGSKVRGLRESLRTTLSCEIDESERPELDVVEGLAALG